MVLFVVFEKMERIKRPIGFRTLTLRGRYREGDFGFAQGLDPMLRIEEVLHPETHGIKKKHPKRVPSIKQVLPAEKTIGVRAFVRTPFHTPCPARYSVLHLLGVLSGGNEPPLCKGRWLAKQDGGIVKAKISS